MKDKFKCMPPPPKRKELCDNPVKLCHDITRLSRAKARGMNFEGIMSQPGARLVLSLLAISDGVTQRFLVEETHLRPPTISVMLGKMESEGMVCRKRNPEDMRETLIYLTDYGREVDQRGIANIKETDALALEGLSPEEIAVLMELLGRVRKNLIYALEEKGEESK